MSSTKRENASEAKPGDEVDKEMNKDEKKPLLR